MPKEYLTTSTNWPEEPSGGALVTPYAVPSGPNVWNLGRSQLGMNLHPVGGYEWMSVDEAQDGRVQFLTTMDVTGQLTPELYQTALCRMVCFYIVGRLTGEALTEAYQSLADVYSWQVSRNYAPHQLGSSRYHRVSRVDKTQSAQFVFQDD